MQQTLPYALAFNERPIVIPSWQQIQSVDHGRRDDKVAPECGSLDQPSCPLIHKVKVHGYVCAQPQ